MIGIKLIGILKCLLGTSRGGLINLDYSGTWGDRGKGNELLSALENGLSWIGDKVINFGDYVDKGLSYLVGLLPGTNEKSEEISYIDEHGNPLYRMELKPIKGGTIPILPTIGNPTAIISTVKNTLSNHLLGEKAVLMFKQYGRVKIPEGSINGELLRKYVLEARIRYGLVGNKNITDEEIAQSLYKHALELGEGSAAKNILGEPLLLFRGDTKRYTELKPRPTPEELEKMRGTMDNSLGNLFLGLMPESMGGLERYIVHVRDFKGNRRIIGSGTGSNAVLPNGNIVKEFTNDVIGTIPEGSYLLYSYPHKYGNISAYKLPASWSESGVNDINAFIVRTPKVRDASREISVLNDDFLVKGGPKVDYYGPSRREVLDKDGFPLLVDETGKVVGNGLAGSSDRSAMAKHYRQVLDKAKNEQLGLLKSDKNSLLRDEHDNYDYFALPNFNIRGAKHLLPYDLRIPRNWDDPNIYKTFIPIGIGTTIMSNNDIRN